MNWKSTLALVILAAAAGVWLWKGDDLAVRLHLRSAPPGLSASVAALDHFTPERIVRVEFQGSAGSVALERDRSGTGWKLPGNWPVRREEVEELVAVLGDLRTRFEPIPVGEDGWHQYGLDTADNPVVLKLTLKDQEQNHTLTFGQPEAKLGDHPFTRPTFARIDTANEVLVLGADVMPIVRRPAEAYRRRQLFPDVARIPLLQPARPDPRTGQAGPPQPVTVTLVGEDVKSIEVRGPAGAFTLRRTGPTVSDAERKVQLAVPQNRLASAWELAAPERDRVEPAKLQSILAAIPELWVEEFVAASDPRAASAGLATPERVITVTSDPSSGGRTELQIGNVARTEVEESIELIPGPMGQAIERQKRVTIEFRFARLAGNPQLFVIKCDRFTDLFSPPAALRDPLIARFSPDEVQRVMITTPGHPPVELVRTEQGEPNPGGLAPPEDKWSVVLSSGTIAADPLRVRELIERLSKLREVPLPAASTATVGPGGTTVRVTARESRPKGQPEAPVRTYTFTLGRPVVENRQPARAAVLGAALAAEFPDLDPMAPLLPVQVAGWPRPRLIEDQGFDMLRKRPLPPVTELLARPALAYREPKLLDLPATDLRAIRAEVTGEKGVKGPFTITRDASAKSGWKITQPPAGDTDPAATTPLVQAVTNLRATEFVSAAPTPAELARFGLAPPRQVVVLAYTGGKEHRLELGTNSDPGSVFARLDGGPVFTLAAAVSDSLRHGAIGLLPTQLWETTKQGITRVEVTKLGPPPESYTLAREFGSWKLTAPFAVAADERILDGLLAPLTSPQVIRYYTLTPGPDTEYGFNKPLLRVKITFREVEPAPPSQPGMPPQPPTFGPEITRTLVVGGPTADGTGRYAKFEGGPIAAVFVVPMPIAEIARVAARDLVGRDLLSFLAERVEKIQIAGPKAEQNIILTRDPKGPWKAEGVSAIDQPTADALALTLARLPVAEIAALGDAVRWSEFGLEPPMRTLTITLGGDKPESHTVKLGKPAPKGGIYARVDDGMVVAVVHAVAVANLTREKSAFVDRTLLTFDPAALTALGRKKGADELAITRTPTGWEITRPVKQPADTAMMGELAQALGQFRAERIAAAGGPELYKQFGLDNPTATITLGIGAVKKVLRIGGPVDAAKPDDDRYVAIEGGTAIGVLSRGPLLRALLAPPFAFRNHTLAAFDTADRVTLERAGRKATFTRTNGVWAMTEPVKATAESADLDELVKVLAGLRAGRIVAEKPTPAELKKFGLDPPQVRCTVSAAGKDVLVLQVGTKDPATQLAYARAAGGELVGLLDLVTTSRLFAEYRTQRVWDVDAAQATGIEVTRGGMKFQFRKMGPAWVDPAQRADRVDARQVNDLVGTLGALRAARYAADADANLKLYGLDKPEVELALELPDGSKRLVQVGGAVGGTGDKQRYARVAEPGRTDVFVLSAADTASLLRARADYLMAAKKPNP